MKSVFILFLILSAIGCSRAKPVNKINPVKIDSVSNGKASVAKGNDTLNFDVKHVKKNSDVSVIHFKNDTVEIVSANPFFYYPFGEFKSINEFELNNKIWHFNSKKLASNRDSTIMYKFGYKNSYLNIIYSSDTRFVEIVKATVADKEIAVGNNIKIGMTKKDFLALFFNDVQNDPVPNVTVIKFISALDVFGTDIILKMVI